MNNIVEMKNINETCSGCCTNCKSKKAEKDANVLPAKAQKKKNVTHGE